MVLTTIGQRFDEVALQRKNTEYPIMYCLNHKFASPEKIRKVVRVTGRQNGNKIILIHKYENASLSGSRILLFNLSTYREHINKWIRIILSLKFW